MNDNTDRIGMIMASPRDFVILVSNDDVNWVTVLKITGMDVDGTDPYRDNTFDIVNDVKYTAYAFTVLKTNRSTTNIGGGGIFSYTGINHLRYFSSMNDMYDAGVEIDFTDLPLEQVQAVAIPGIIITTPHTQTLLTLISLIL